MKSSASASSKMPGLSAVGGGIGGPLPVLAADNPCRGCGVCCTNLGMPPFIRRGRHPERAWQKLRRNHPELAAQVLLLTRLVESGALPDGPCCWYDPASRSCRHYDLRPRICRDFEPGGDDCQDVRRRCGVDGEEG